jgi:predicted nucleotidyltransferase
LTDKRKIVYNEERWQLFNLLRSEASDMMHPFTSKHISSIAYGSIARGDVSEDSDIDVFIPKPPAPTLIEAVIEQADIKLTSREIVQATPTHAAKGYINLGEKRSYSFPLVDLRTVEFDFHGFAGSISPNQLEQGFRVSGVNKRIMLIEPTKWGHIESPVEGKEGTVAKKLGIGINVVLERVRILRRREKVGRTGVYLKRSLAPNESFGEVFKKLAEDRPAIRRRLRMK